MTTETKYVEIKEEENGDMAIYPAESAPPEFIEWWEENQTRAELLINFGVVLEGTGHGEISSDESPLKAKEYAEKERAKMEQAIEREDWPAVKRHKKAADDFDEIYHRYRTEVLDVGK